MRFVGAAPILLAVGCASATSPTVDDPNDPDDPNTDAPQSAQVSVVVAKQGTGVGTVTSVPTGIDCGETCMAMFEPGTVVTLTAAPTTGTTFMGWSGGGCGTGSTCSASVEALGNVAAMFSCDPGTITFAFTGGPETFTPPVCVTSITVDAFGAQGGRGVNGNGQPGGLGARIRGTVPITPAGVTIIVGGIGADFDNGSAGHGGGGGASWVYTTATDPTPLIVAGGGGGASSNSNGGCTPGPGSATNDATASTGGAGNGSGGTNGTGGSGGGVGQFAGPGGGGAGWTSDGIAGSGGGTGGLAPRNGGDGGNTTGGANGGFGGGGSGFGNSGACGGGGGYNGGGGGSGWNGNAWGCGGGGGSFNAGANPINTAGVRAGSGQVTISW
jgi:hypothetical protein